MQSIMAAIAKSLVEAIKQKYDPDCSDEVSTFKHLKEVAISQKPGTLPVQQRTTLVLESHGISTSGDQDELECLCPKVREMHLSSNTISDWSEISNILCRLKSVTFLDLTYNPLCSSTFAPANPLSPAPSLPSALSTLVLNHVSLTLTAVQTCLDALPCLEELHLTNNGYQEVTFRPGSCYPKLQKLFIGHNKLSEWRDITTLGTVFPSLRHLMAASNPLSIIPPLVERMAFPCLINLNLNNTLVDSWDSVDHLGCLPSLVELSILNIVAGRGMDEKERRFEAIGRLTKLRLLNKSTISSEEREDAERWLIRKYKDLHDHTPAACPPLLEKYGALNPLVEVSLTPTCNIDLEFHIRGRDPQVHSVSLYQSTYDLKVWLSKITGVPPNAMILFYGDVEAIQIYGLEEMRFNSKALYTYNMKSGDSIYVDFK